MVDRLRPMDRVPTVNTPTRVRPVRRDRHRHNQRDHQSEEEPKEKSPGGHESPKPDANRNVRKEKMPVPGQRISIVI